MGMAVMGGYGSSWYDTLKNVNTYTNNGTKAAAGMNRTASGTSVTGEGSNASEAVGSREDADKVADQLAGGQIQDAEDAEDADDTPEIVRNPGKSKEKQPGKKSSPAECETCKNRKYQDGSDEMVSYKTAAHIDPGQSAAKVMAHEQEHVANAYKKASQNNGEVESCTVTLKNAICPECGTSYVAGGETRTQIKYTQEESAYKKAMEAQDPEQSKGNYFDMAV